MKPNQETLVNIRGWLFVAVTVLVAVLFVVTRLHIF